MLDVTKFFLTNRETISKIWNDFETFKNCYIAYKFELGLKVDFQAGPRENQNSKVQIQSLDQDCH